MRLHVVFDEQGTIVSANTLLPESAVSGGMGYGPVLEKNQQEATIDVPQMYAQASLAKIAEDLRVNADAGTYALVPKKG